ncbi:phosphatidylinositol N-acetylglucosaminyltransferase subunit A isoform X2 [Lathyrus oleraceus]|uniref:phosphatidylinositol N-acetylglucosaminyltransferase subunit A isoform X2 n=1 Tax=Pisum sativum TaxID=3888 RepID=UPI0021D1D12E|nr:phosphatidylinositol N-acetylglucosaminyltransferase subunit A-like isoform X2 [Pisum sativum]XP_050916225.1 phosphatidylinositol N-acetylglucosaminyltransferase subunit A-like isoform X2 [Pisum sativum]
MGTTLYCQRLWKHPLAHICRGLVLQYGRLALKGSGTSSLTEAFCIAILEAASCGLLTVSTRVGGVPEVVPDDMIVLAEPDPSDMVRAIQRAITMLPKIDPQVMHNRMRELYSWHDVSKRTEIVYDRALKCSDQNLLERLSRYLSCGAWAGKIFCLVMIFNFLLWHLLELWQPADEIEEAPDVILSRNCDGLEGCCRKYNNAENYNSSDTNNIS